LVGSLDPAAAGPARRAAGSVCDVLHVPYTYFPDATGGTEIYVAGLVRALRSYGMAGAVAAPAPVEAAYDHDEAPVFRFATDLRPGLGHAYGAPDAAAARSFGAVLGRLRPRIVHLHARTAAVSVGLVDLAHQAGAKTVLTYHTPTVSCARGTMLRMGRSPCDGALHRRRCTRCVLAQHGVPLGLRGLVARTPPALGDALARVGLGGGAFTALRLPALIGAAHRDFRELARKVDRIVAPCDWVCEVLRRNGVAEQKLVLCRQGLAAPAAPHPPDPEAAAPPGVLRLGYFGRLDPTKGVDILVEALRLVPKSSVRLDIYGVQQPGSEAYAARLKRAAAGDPRIAFQPALPPDRVVEAMRRVDLVAVPSRWLETGPLVVIEAFAAGTPVLGARRGGVAELVRDRVDGVLAEPEDPAAWAAAIAALATAPAHVRHLRAGIRPPRRMDDVARDMSHLYRTLLADGHG
jgi:glycosyltransferase involved in cell wall biosynthesis